MKALVGKNGKGLRMGPWANLSKKGTWKQRQQTLGNSRLNLRELNVTLL